MCSGWQQPRNEGGSPRRTNYWYCSTSGCVHMIVEVLMVVVQDERSYYPEILQPHTILVCSFCVCSKKYSIRLSQTIISDTFILFSSSKFTVYQIENNWHQISNTRIIQLVMVSSSFMRTKQASKHDTELN